MMLLPEPGTADLYLLDLAQAVDPALLSDAERERAQALRPLHHRQRFERRRSMLRTILGSYLAIEPRVIDFAIGPWGKPALRDSPLMFSMSSSGDRAIVAVTQRSEIGVDVEQVRDLDDVDQLIRSYVPAPHATQLRELPASVRSRAFLRWWTQYEATLKARGLALSAAPLRDDYEPAPFLSVAGSSVTHICALASYARLDSIVLRTYECSSRKP